MSTTLRRPEYPAGGYVGIAHRCRLLALLAHLQKQMAVESPARHSRFHPECESEQWVGGDFSSSSTAGVRG
jgi:hypothetical protein